jgi:hypothetical protein
MRAHEYPLEGRGSPLYLWYSTLGLNATTIVPVLYFLTVARCQVRFYVSTRSVIFRTCWQSQTSSLAMMLQKCTTMLILLLWLKSQPRDLVSWHQSFFFHKMVLIHHMNAHLGSSSMTTCLLCRLPSSTLGPRHVVKIAIPGLDKSPLWRISPFPQFLIQNHQQYPTDLHR